MQQLSLPLCFNPGRSLADFWVHAKNAELLYQLEVLIGDKSHGLFIWGKSGSGKSHLLEAMCKRADDFGLRAGYVDFTAVQDLSTAVLDNLETLDLVCLDNIDALDDEQYNHFQVAVFHLFNDLKARNKRLLVSSCKPIDEHTTILPDLMSRLAWGLVYQVWGFDQLDSHAFLHWSVAHRGMLISPTCAQYILRHYKRDSHALIVLLNQLEQSSLAEQRRLTIPFIRQVIQALPS